MKEKSYKKGICNVCGFTWQTPCVDEKWGSCPCGWVLVLW